MEEIKLADFEGLATLQDDAHPRVSFFIEGSRIYKKTEIGSYSGLVDLELEQLPIKHFSRAELARTWGLTCLKTKMKFLEPQSATTSLSVADFFCGAGGLSLGVGNALRSLGFGVDYKLACDRSQESLDVYNANFFPSKMVLNNVGNLLRAREFKVSDGVTFPVASSVELAPEISEFCGKIDLFVAGPPCEGNSNLNNRTRRSDLRNNHYLSAALIGASLGAQIILLEMSKPSQNLRKMS